ncbi:MAG: NACHT domain-containing protein, partial [bacterium]|nr:NACHT domain-containing protein [bacterium]
GIDRFPDESVVDIVNGIKKQDEIKEDRDKEEERIPIQATEAVGALRRLVILGRPGGGKSTLVNHLSTALVRQRMTGKDESLPGWPSDENPISVRIVLRQFAAWIPANLKKGTEGLIWDYLEHLLGELGCRKFFPSLKYILDNDGGVVFFDGLDEVSASDAENKRAHIIEAIRSFSRPLEKCRIIVTCREYAYQGGDAWRFPASEFPVVELDLFRSDQIKNFTRTWYRMTGAWKGWNEKRCLHEAENLFQAVEDWPHLRALGRYPLLLTLMAQVHGRDGYLPRDRADLYERAVNLLLAHWENHIVRDLDGSCRVEPGLIMKLGIRVDTLRTALE